jgi:hypothetical protein
LAVIQKEKVEDKELKEKVIAFNIGGQRFCLSKATLLKHENSYFVKLFDGRAPIVKDKNGDFFIDRNGNLFHHVVEYLYNEKFYMESKGKS